MKILELYLCMETKIPRQVNVIYQIKKALGFLNLGMEEINLKSTDRHL